MANNYICEIVILVFFKTTPHLKSDRRVKSYNHDFGLTLDAKLTGLICSYCKKKVYESETIFKILTRCR